MMSMRFLLIFLSFVRCCFVDWHPSNHDLMEMGT